VSPLLDDDDALEALWKKQYSLTALTAADQFKSYEQLETRLKMVLGQKRAPAPRIEDEEDTDRGSFSPEFSSRKESTELPQDLKAELNNLGSSSQASTDSDEDDALSYFQRLANE